MCSAIKALCTVLAGFGDFRADGSKLPTKRAKSEFTGWSMRVTRAEWLRVVFVDLYGSRRANGESSLEDT